MHSNLLLVTGIPSDTNKNNKNNKNKEKDKSIKIIY